MWQAGARVEPPAEDGAADPDGRTDPLGRPGVCVGRLQPALVRTTQHTKHTQRQQQHIPVTSTTTKHSVFWTFLFTISHPPVARCWSAGG